MRDEMGLCGGGGGGLMRFDSKSHLGIVLDAYKRDSD